MKTYETSATVGEQGRILVADLPFPPGTEVTVAIKPARDDGTMTDRAAPLLAALNKGRNTEPVGSLRREELYDRQVLR